jgi:hypothetical protein
MKNSGERFARPGGISDGGKRGKLERRARVFIGEGTEWPLRSPGSGIVGEIKTTVSSEWKRPEVEGEADRWVPPVGEGEWGGLYRFGIELGGLRVLFLIWAEGLPRGLLFFSFFLFCNFFFSIFCFPFLP